MIKRNMLHQKKDIDKEYSHLLNSASRNHRIGGFIIAAFLLLGIFTSCSSSNSTPNTSEITPTASPTPTEEPPQPETALEGALERFDDVQSFTVTGTGSSQKSDGDGWTETSMDRFDQANQTSLRESETTLDWDEDYMKFCTPSACYSADATGLLKPVNSIYTTYRPDFESLDRNVPEILDSNYTYVGENTIDGTRVFEYEISVTKEMIDAYKEPPAAGISTSILVEPYPVMTLYVNAEDGYLVRTIETYHSTYDFIDYEYAYVIEKNFSGWNTTTFPIPEYVDAQNTDWQEYTGKYSKFLSFQFPKVYSLSEIYDYPKLKTPQGSTMNLRLFSATIASLTTLEGAERDQETGVAVCYGVVQLWLLQTFSGSPVIESTEWFNMNGLDFCKAVISSDSGQEIEYLFNEPLDNAQADGRMFPATFWIYINPAEGDDANTIFKDVIETIGFVND